MRCKAICAGNVFRVYMHNMRMCGCGCEDVCGLAYVGGCVCWCLDVRMYVWVRGCVY